MRRIVGGWWIAGTLALLCSQSVDCVVVARRLGRHSRERHPACWRRVWVHDERSMELSRPVSSRHCRKSRQTGRIVTRDRGRPLATSGARAALPSRGRCRRPARIHNYRLRFRGRIRSAPDKRWMPFEAEQQSVAGDHSSRFFLMRARMFGLPVEAFHRLVDGHARMHVRPPGIIPMVDASR